MMTMPGPSPSHKDSDVCFCAATELAQQLLDDSEKISRLVAIPSMYAPIAADLVDVCLILARALVGIGDAIRSETSERIDEIVATCPSGLPKEILELPRKLRATNHLGGLHVTNAVSSAKSAIQLMHVFGKPGKTWVEKTLPFVSLFGPKDTPLDEMRKKALDGDNEAAKKVDMALSAYQSIVFDLYETLDPKGKFEVLRQVRLVERL